MTDCTSLTEKNARHSSVANLQVTNVRVNIILSKKRPERKSWPTFVFVISLLFLLFRGYPTKMENHGNVRE